MKTKVRCTSNETVTSVTLVIGKETRTLLLFNFWTNFKKRLSQKVFSVGNLYSRVFFHFSLCGNTRACTQVGIHEQQKRSSFYKKESGKNFSFSGFSLRCRTIIFNGGWDTKWTCLSPNTLLTKTTVHVCFWGNFGNVKVIPMSFQSVEASQTWLYSWVLLFVVSEKWNRVWMRNQSFFALCFKKLNSFKNDVFTFGFEKLTHNEY